MGGLSNFCLFRVSRDGDNKREVLAGTLTMILVFALCGHVREIFVSIRIRVFGALHPACFERLTELLQKDIQHEKRVTGFHFAMPNKGALSAKYAASGTENSGQFLVARLDSELCRVGPHILSCQIEGLGVAVWSLK